MMMMIMMMMMMMKRGRGRELYTLKIDQMLKTTNFWFICDNFKLVKPN
jgi:hypothetical protein